MCAALIRAPCQNACPAGVQVPGYVSFIGEGRYADALRLHRERNPLAAACARVCPHGCEDKCRRSGLDSAVSVRGLKRFMTDAEDGIALPEIHLDPVAASRGVAIVGAGPSGLSCAFFLARLGYRPTVFEASDKAGGLLVQGIPAYRLPRSVVEREVRLIERMGVEIKLGQRLGRDFSLDDLKARGFEAVFLGLGAAGGQKAGTPGEDADGVVDSMEYLRDWNRTGKARPGKRVAVIGGGNAAIDAARTALRLGAESVTVLDRPAPATRCRRTSRRCTTRSARACSSGSWPRRSRSSPGTARSTGVRCQLMQLGEFDRSGRRRPVAVQGAEVVEAADLVITAIGQTLAPIDPPRGSDLARKKNGFLVVDARTGQTTVPWVFAGGDAASGPSSVVEAVAGGERAAVGIDRMLTGASRAFWRDDRRVDTVFDADADPCTVPRATPRTLPVAQRRGNFTEIEQALCRADAQREAHRCLRCDYREPSIGGTHSC